MISPSKSCATHCGAAISRTVCWLMTFPPVKREGRYHRRVPTSMRGGRSSRIVDGQEIPFREYFRALQPGLVGHVAIALLGFVETLRVHRLVPFHARRPVR